MENNKQWKINKSKFAGVTDLPDNDIYENISLN